MTAPTVQHTVDHLFRHESGKMVAVLSKLLGFQQLQVAQDIVQDTLLQALQSWSFNGIPDNPSGWLYRVAQNKAIDLLRREKKFREISPRYAYLLESEYTLLPTINQLFEEESINDSQLGMIFACCHPSINIESQIALALKTLCGLGVNEIARAFLTSEETIAKRIYRAKEKIRTEGIEPVIPPAQELPARLDAVLHCIYLLFNEGYNSSHPDELIREELCEEAMRLAYLLTQQRQTALSRTKALIALFCFQASRLQSRIDDGHIILLKYQDRNRWFRPLMDKGFQYLDEAISGEFENSTYHIEAAIAALHASAPSFEETDWKGIHSLYEHLFMLHPSPVIAMNKAIAMGYASSREKALEALSMIKGLDEYYLFHTAVGELNFELNRKEEAANYYRKAMKRTHSKIEQDLLKSKIQQCQDSGDC